MPSAGETSRRATLKVIAEARRFLLDLDQSRTPSGQRPRRTDQRELIDQSHEMIDRTHDLVRDSRRRVARLTKPDS